MFVHLTTKIGSTETPIYVNLAEIRYIRESTSPTAPGCFLHLFPDTQAQPLFVLQTAEQIFARAHL